MTQHRYDLMVIGAGMAGVSAATKCAAQGWSVAIVDALPYGGTCALRGCDCSVGVDVDEECGYCGQEGHPDGVTGGFSCTGGEGERDGCPGEGEHS